MDFVDATPSTVLCYLSKTEREESKKEGTLCSYCFATFENRGAWAYHLSHTCWHSPYDEHFCRKKKCHCLRFRCGRWKVCRKSFVTEFEKGVHEKYYCPTSVPPFLTREEYHENKFICHHCGKGHGTPLRVGLCNCCEPDEGEDESKQTPVDCNVFPVFKCLLCDMTFKTAGDYEIHDCVDFY